MTNNRIESIDLLRGFTIAGMILVNNQIEGDQFAPLGHADWIGLTPADLIFPTFMFIMGITTYLSLRKYDFNPTRRSLGKIAKRALLLWFVGLALSWLLQCVAQLCSPANASLPFGQWMSHAAFTPLQHLRILGVLPRLGICYGMAALLAVSVRHRYIPWIVAVLFVGYFIILETGNGYAHDSTNILAIVDDAVLGHSHVYRWDTPDPEGLLSTLPALGHVLIGFCMGHELVRPISLDEKIERMFAFGSMMLTAGWLLSFACPISKKLWTPTFSLVTCGAASLILAILTIVVDKYKKKSRLGTFFEVFGCNPLALYVFSDLLLIPYADIIWVSSLGTGGSLSKLYAHHILGTLPPNWSSLLWSLLFVFSTWGLGYYLWKKHIYIKL